MIFAASAYSRIPLSTSRRAISKKEILIFLHITDMISAYKIWRNYMRKSLVILMLGISLFSYSNENLGKMKKSTYIEIEKDILSIIIKR